VHTKNCGDTKATVVPNRKIRAYIRLIQITSRADIHEKELLSSCELVPMINE